MTHHDATQLHHEVTPGPEGAPTVVLSNSLGSTLHMWDRNVDELAKHFTVVRYDTRGHGKSPVLEGPAPPAELCDAVIDLLDSLGIAQPGREAGRERVWQCEE